MGMPEAGKYKAVALAYGEAAGKVRTNGHVEGANRKSRFAEKSRCGRRRRKWVVRWVLLALGLWRVRSGGQHRAGAATPRRLKGRWVTVGMSAECRPRPVISSSRGGRAPGSPGPWCRRGGCAP